MSPAVGKRSGVRVGDSGGRWNHNIHYHRIVLDAVPRGVRSALDIGTGDGLLAADLRARIPHVVGIDIDEPVLAQARAHIDDVEWIAGDVLTYPFGRTFDVVASVASLHHLPDVTAALQRFSDLVAPGGVLVVIGLARSTTVSDFAHDLVGAVCHRWYLWRRGHWEHSAPTVWPPPNSYAEVRDSAQKVLPGVRWRRFSMFRYAVIWDKPAHR